MFDCATPPDKSVECHRLERPGITASNMDTCQSLSLIPTSAIRIATLYEPTSDKDQKSD